MPPLDITDAEHLKRVVVDPLIKALRAEMREAIRPLIDEIAAMRQRESERQHRLDSLERRLGRLERFKTKIVALCSAAAVVAGIAWRLVSDWASNFFFKGHS